MLKIEFKEAIAFLKALDPIADYRSVIDGLPDGFTFQTFDDKDKKNTRFAKIIHGTLRNVHRELAQMNLGGAGVFVTMNETDGTGRKLSNIIRPRAVWIEDDTYSNIPTPLQPQIITETSPGKYHKIFIVDRMSPADHRRLQDTLVANYGSDPDAKDLARVLRVPGFFHNKRDRFRSRLVSISGPASYTVQQMFDAFGISVQEAPVHKEASKPTKKDDYQPITENDFNSLVLPDITLKNCVKYLPEEYDLSYSRWRNVGMALHSQFEGSDEALELFDNWSSLVKGYKGFADVAYFWRSFGSGAGRHVTFKWLVKEYNLKHPTSRLTVPSMEVSVEDAEATGKKLLEDCKGHRELLDTVAPQLQALSAASISLRSDFTKWLMVRYSKLVPGEKLTKAEAERAMKARKKATSHRTANSPFDQHDLDQMDRAPEWAKNWCWISTEERFFNIITGSIFTEQAFNNHYRRHANLPDEGKINLAVSLRDSGMVPMVEVRMYIPWADTYFQDSNGCWCVNTYSPQARVPVPEGIKNFNAVDIFKRHIELVCGGWNREAVLLCNFLKYCTADKPVKIRWAPLLIGNYGDGKSFFHNFMTKAMGEKNVKVVPNNLIIASATTGQSGWSEGSCFAFIEELKLHGHNRFDVSNTLKPYLTNDIIPCRRLYAESRSIPNTQNYFASSNYQDCIPMSKGDRRWFVLFNKLLLDQLPERYFKNLHDSLEFAGDIIVWLREIPDHADFDVNGPAPATSEKRMMLELSNDDFVDVARDFIAESPTPFVSDEVICIAHLKAGLLAAGLLNEGRKSADYVIRNALLEIGYVKAGRITLPESGSLTVWVRYRGIDTLSPLEARQLIMINLAAIEYEEHI